MSEYISIPIQTKSGLRLSALNPKYLHTNSTSHTWPFSAIAELVDNAYDPDVKASQLQIDIKNYKFNQGFQLAMIFTDNGNGMCAEKLYKMLSFGFCEKVAVRNHMPVGHYGNGFKSGSMRLGKDALVFTKCSHTKSVGYLSQTYLSSIKADTVVVPIVTWSLITGKILLENDKDSSLDEILKHSIINTKRKIEEEFENIKSKTGTRIIISNLRSSGKCVYEFDFSVMDDIRIPDDVIGSEERKYKREERQQHIPASDYSLRAYLSILYLKPKMQIILRGSKVKTVVIAKSLSKTEVDVYKPANKSQIKIVFGFSQNENHYGIMMYHRNRLIKPYVRVGCQLKANDMGVGVIGVIECDLLQPTHNKQDFDYSPLYRSTMTALGMKLNDYWNEKCGINATDKSQLESNNEIPDENWVQCDNTDCLKWRKLPDDVNVDKLPDKWYCHMHPSTEWNNCSVPEEEEDAVDNVKPYEKKLKKIEKELRQKEADKILNNSIDINIERRRREKAEYEKQQRDVEVDRLHKELQQYRQSHQMNSLEFHNHVNSTPTTPNTVKKRRLPDSRKQSNSTMDQPNNSQTLQKQISDPGPSRGVPDITAIKSEEDLEIYKEVQNGRSINELGTKKRPYTIESSDEEEGNNEGRQSKLIKVENSYSPLQELNKTAMKQAESNDNTNYLKDAIFNINPDDLNGIDPDIIEDLKQQTITGLGVTLAKRSQALRNIRKKVVKLIQTIVSDTLQYPDVSKQSIDENWVELLLDTIINIEQEEEKNN